MVILLIRSFMVLALGSTRVWEYTHTRLDSLLFGVLLSYLYINRPEFPVWMVRRRLLLGSVAALGIAFIFLVGDDSRLMRTVGFTCNYLAYGALLLCVVSLPATLFRGLLSRAIIWIGTYSYSIYLWHLLIRRPVLKLAMHFSGWLEGLILFAGSYLVAIALGVVMAKLIEWPALRLREKLIPA